MPYKKFDGSLFKVFLDQSPYENGEHIYVGDSLAADILPAKSLGMKTILIGKENSEADFSVNSINSPQLEMLVNLNPRIDDNKTSSSTISLV